MGTPASISASVLPQMLAWEVPSHTLLPGDWMHPQPVHSLAFNRAGDRLITASVDKKARVFAVPGGADRPVPLFEPGSTRRVARMQKHG